MKIIGFQFVGETAGSKKHYSVVLTEFGELLKHTGKMTTRQVNGRRINETAGGRLTKEGLETLSAPTIFNKFSELYNEKYNSGEYTHVTWSFETQEMGRDFDTIQFISGDAVAPLVNKWAAIVDNSLILTGHARNSKKGFNVEIAGTDGNLHTERASILNFVEKMDNSNRPATFTIPKEEAKNNFFTKVDGPVVRPNGEAYRPREIMGHTDVALLREFRSKSVYVRLAGPPGAGKTALAEAAFNDLITINGHGDMTVANFVGSFLPQPDGGWIWQDGPLVRAMREGKALLVDEGTRIPTEVLNILFSVMDGRRALKLDDRPDLPVVHAKEGFYVIMGYNPDTLGARPLDEALISRFRVQITVETDMATAKALGVPALAIRITENLRTRSAKFVAEGNPRIWAPEMRELLCFRDLINMNVGEDFALATLIASCPREDDTLILREVIHSLTKKKVDVPSLGGLV